MRDLEKFCTKLTTNILNGQLFITFLRDLTEIMIKELPKDPLMKNSYFEEKFIDYMEYKIENITLEAQDPSLKAKFDKPLLQLITNYALMRTLFPKKEDSKLFKKIWGLMKFCPMISVYGLHSLNIGNFLNAIVPLKKSTKCEPKDIKIFLTETMYAYDKSFIEFVQSKFMSVASWLVLINGRFFKSMEDSDKNLD